MVARNCRYSMHALRYFEWILSLCVCAGNESESDPLNLVLVISVSFAICSFLILLCGLLLGVLISRCYWKRASSKNKTKSPPSPIYEEVIIQTCNELNSLKLEDDMVYGPINIKLHCHNMHLLQHACTLY